MSNHPIHWFDTHEEMIQAVDKDLNESINRISLPCDRGQNFSRGFILFNGDVDEADENPVEYRWAVYGSREDCEEICIDDRQAYKDKLASIGSDLSNVIWPCDNVKTMKIGFCVYPERKWYTISARSLGR